MSEFAASNPYKNGRVQPISSHHTSSNSNGHYKNSVPIEDDDEIDRGHWGSKAEFILSCVGYSVGIGNVWRFPYLAYSNGGGSFLIPYFILLIFIGKPMYYMETAIGQFSRLSPLQVWRCAPIAKGVGYAMCVVSLIVAIYYNVIMAYSIIYIGATVQGIVDGQLPWTYCGDWSDENCVVPDNTTAKDVFGLQKCSATVTENCTNAENPSEQFWYNAVLNISLDGLGEPGDLGGFDYKLPLALMFSWLIVFLCLMKGVKSSGKVVYFTATFPYVILIALLVRGVTLPGATTGLYYLVVPEWEKLLEATVWKKAAEQMFFSLGVSWGGLMMFGSYNKFNNKINLDAGFVSSLDFFTSIIASVVIFSVLGFLSEQLGVDIKDVAAGGQGLAFIAYPTALAKLPLPELWSILFFAMLFFLGLDSEFALLETVLTAMYDGYPKLRNHKVKMTFIACVCCYLLGLPCCSYAGQYVLDLMDTYGAGFAILWIAFWECVGFMWIYGVKNVCKDIKLMIGSEPGWFWKITWAGVAPIFLLVIFIASVVQWQKPQYNGNIAYPEWAHSIGWTLVGLSAVQIPLWAILMTLYYLFKRKISQVIKPDSKWGPGDKAVRKQILEEMAGMPTVSRYSYDNNGMAYEAYHM